MICVSSRNTVGSRPLFRTFQKKKPEEVKTKFKRFKKRNIYILLLFNLFSRRRRRRKGESRLRRKDKMTDK